MSSTPARQPRQPRQQAGRTGQAGRARQRRSRAARPLPQGDTLFTPEASPARQAVEHQSATPLLWLYQLPAWLLPLLAAGLAVTGLAVGGWGGAAALLGVAVLLSWLAALSWPRLSAGGRVLRAAVICCVLALAVFRGTHG